MQGRKVYYIKNMVDKPVTSNEFKREIKKLSKRLDEKVGQLDKKVDHLDEKVGNLDKKIDEREMSLRAEIRITAEETIEQIEEKIRQGNQRVLDKVIRNEPIDLTKYSFQFE